jgi:Heterogeneous nuclear ribonucleoprotein Q acidic domain
VKGLHYIGTLFAGLLSDGDLDERAIDAIKEFPPERALEVLAEFKQSNLEHVTNKSAFLCSIMKVNRQKIKTSGQDVSSQPALKRPGPDDAKIKVCKCSKCQLLL